MKMNNETYDKVKWVVMILMPALTTLVGGLGQAYGWGQTDLAVTTLTLITTFMGAVTLKSTSNYNKED
ncbi:phage holin [Enterococcus pseudoavium]|uniref:Phage holin n=1 Tax=Enterococcus pseudoavium TaxID=44007 RepID=A0AAE4I4S0_9ENTE|nr:MULTISPECIES: phage holin [Enterococcus]MBU5369589.1 phage holin [Enterococcus avium]MDT2737970.1 phage holin [Enterococcus pseudoavium]